MASTNPLKLLFKVVFLLMILMFTIIVGVVTFIDPNNYKEEVNALVQKATGRSFKINGSIQWSLTPKVALYVQDAHIGNHKDFAGPFLTVKEAHVKLDIYPLLKGKLSINGIELQGVHVNLQRNAKGLTNYDDLVARFAPPETATTLKQNVSTSSNALSSSNAKASTAPSIKIDELFIKNSSLHWQDALSDVDYNLTQFNVITRNLDLKKLTPPIQIDGLLTNSKEIEPIAIKFNTALTLDLSNDALNIQGATLHWHNVTLNFDANIEKLRQQPVVKGKISLATLNPNTLLKKLQQPEQHSLPGQVSFSSNFNYAGNLLTLNALHLSLDNALLTGETSIRLTKNPHITYDLNTQRLNLEQLSLLTAAFSTALKPTASSASKAELFPIQTLRNLSFEGKIKAHELFATPELIIDKMDTQLQAKNGLITAKSAVLNFADGQHELTATLDVRQATPKLFLTNQSTQFELAKATKCYLTNKTIYGNADLQFNFQTQGNDKTSLINNLSGQAKLKVDHGAIYGVDIHQLLKFAEKNIRKIFSMIKDKEITNIPNLIVSEAESWDAAQSKHAKTPFDRLSASASIKNGVINNHTFQLSHENYAVTGKGFFSLPQQTIDYMASATIHVKKDKDDVLSYMLKTPFPVKITGTFSQPIVQPQMNQYLNAALTAMQQTVLKDVVKKSLSKILGTSHQDTTTDEESSDKQDPIKSLGKKLESIIDSL